MGVFDKIKNALFEVEYVEVEEPPKKEKKKDKIKEKTLKRDKDELEVEETVESKPIAKRVVLPGKREEKVHELKEEELRDDNFESRPKDEEIKLSRSDKFDFNDDDLVEETHRPEIVKVIEKEEVEPIEDNYVRKERVEKSTRLDRDNTRDEINSTPVQRENSHNKEMIDTNKYYNKPKPSSNPYGMDRGISVSMHEYGAYERKEEKAGFKPSPIISPIYGVLDKNYKKEDVVSKKEIRVASSYSRSNVSVDEVRNKALGMEEEEVKETRISDINDEPKRTVPTTFEVDEDEENLLVDLTDDKEKPEVKELTMGDALEYFQDLGLEYNVDYVDASKNKTNKVQSMKPKNEKEDKDTNILSVLDKETPKEENIEEKEDKIKTVIKNESPIGTVNSDDDDDDNLFDLIDSMYEEKGV